MKMTFILFALILGCSSSKQSMPDNKFENTTWISKVAPNCIDTLKFMRSSRVHSYSCELDYAFKGSYNVKGNTLFLTVTEDSHETPEIWRYKFVLPNEILTLLSSERLLKGKWEVQKNAIDVEYVFTKVKSQQEPQ